ncbi:MAG: LacI family DNA-binding transcriptional regulator [Planctomycetota bacterium]
MGSEDFLRQPFPARGAVEALQRRVVQDLRRRMPPPGSPFPTDGEVVQRSGLSRSTVRRAFTELQREGWLSREAGRGTFVGPRLGVPDSGTSTISPEGQPLRAGATLRIAVVMFDISALNRDWITPTILSGIDEQAEEIGAAVELLGLREKDTDSLGRRLERTRPDVLISLAAQPRDALLLRDAMRLGIPTLVVGTAHQFLGLPAVVEDNLRASKLAVRTLAEAGHERIGLVLNRWPGAWVFQRHEGFGEAMSEAGLDHRVPGTCWIGTADHPGHHDQRLHAGGDPFRQVTSDGDSVPVRSPFVGGADNVAHWLERYKPTAVVCGSYSAIEAVGDAAKKIGLSIPRDLSIVAFDPHPMAKQWLGVKPTLVKLPLRELGREAARKAGPLYEKATLPDVTLVPFKLSPGDSVARHVSSIDSRATTQGRKPRV